MRIAVIGAGVLGSLYAARPAFAGQTVTLVARGGRLNQLQQGPILILKEDNGARAGGWPDGATVRYRLIPEQPTTLGEPDGSLSPRLRQIAKALETAGLTFAPGRHMDDWPKTHAMFVTAIAGAIYLGHGNTSAVAKSRDSIRTLVRGIRRGFGLLSDAGVAITPKKLGLLVGLPAILAEIYLRRFLTRPAAELILARRANAVPAKLATLIGELRAIVRLEPGAAPDLEILWAALTTTDSEPRRTITPSPTVSSDFGQSTKRSINPKEPPHANDESRHFC